MRAVVIGNGDINDYEYISSLIRNDDTIICADGGLRHAEAMGLITNVAIGDFDSYKSDIKVKKFVYPERKDYTDGELAVQYAIDNGYDEIMLLGMTGKRLDHTLTDILLLSKYENSYLIDDYNEVHIVSSKLVLRDKKGKTLSIIPVLSDLKGITTKGLEYPLHDETLFFGESRGNSNVVTDDTCIIEVRSGMGIVIINNGD